MPITTFLQDLVQRIQLAQAKSEATFIIPTRDLAELVDMYYDACDEIHELEDEVAGLVREVEEGGK